jgi:MFS family permease
MSEAGVFRRTFSSLRHRNYRLLWTGTIVSNSGDWMDQIALNWLVMELTHSPLALGLVNLFRAIPVLILMPLGGVIADKWERRRILVAMQTASMLLALALGILVTTGYGEVWPIYVIAVLRGMVTAFNTPAQQSIISDLVPRHDLANAVALNSATIHLTRVLGPSLGGALIVILGLDWLFYLNALSYVAILYTLWLLPDLGTLGKKGGGPLQEMTDGFRYIRGHEMIFFLVLLAVVPMVFGQPYLTMLAVFAHSVLEVGPTGLGLLMSVASLGAVTGALAVAGRRRGPRIALMIGGIMVFGLSLILFSFSTSMLPALLFLFIAGASNVHYNSTNNALIQSLVEDRYRGRVLSILQLSRGVVPMGSAITGFLAELFGAPAALAGMASMLLVLGAIAYVVRPRTMISADGEEVPLKR